VSSGCWRGAAAQPLRTPGALRRAERQDAKRKSPAMPGFFMATIRSS
jgi:hypothetical protein